MKLFLRARQHLVGHGWSTAALCVALAIVGCGSTPAPRVHSLLGADSVTRVNNPPSLTSATTRAGATAKSSSTGAFVLEPIRLPASVDQPQWLVRLPDDSLASLESERWASPLGDEFRQALLVELFGRFGLVDARDDRAYVASAWRVRVEVLRFESIAGREARIEGSWTITAPLQVQVNVASAASGARAVPQPAPQSIHCDWRFAQPAGAAMPALAAAHRKNVARLADAVGEAITRLQQGEALGCRAD